MVRGTVFLLAVFFSLVYAGERNVCLINSYDVAPAKRVERRLRELLEERGYTLVDSGCSLKLVIGTPALIEALKKDRFSKLVYTFVLFPEELGVKDREGVYGVRIFPLPERTVRAFMRLEGLERIEVAVPISEEMYSIAKKYLPKEYFRVIVFKSRPSEVYDKIARYRYVYVFPDPKLLRLANLLPLLKFGRQEGIVFLAGLGDLKKYGLDFVQEVSYQKLAEKMVTLLEEEPKEKIVPCPVKEDGLF